MEVHIVSEYRWCNSHLIKIVLSGREVSSDMSWKNGQIAIKGLSSVARKRCAMSHWLIFHFSLPPYSLLDSNGNPQLPQKQGCSQGQAPCFISPSHMWCPKNIHVFPHLHKHTPNATLTPINIVLYTALMASSMLLSPRWPSIGMVHLISALNQAGRPKLQHPLSKRSTGMAAFI